MTDINIRIMFINLIEQLERWFDINEYDYDNSFATIWFTHTNGFDYIVNYKVERLN